MATAGATRALRLPVGPQSSSRRAPKAVSGLGNAVSDVGSRRRREAGGRRRDQHHHHQQQHQQHQRGLLLCRASEEQFEGLQESVRNTAAKVFDEGVKAGRSEDEMVAEMMGTKELSEMSDTQRAYATKVKESLAKRAAELAQKEAERPGAQEYELGQRLYGRGRYAEAVDVLLEGLRLSGEFSKLGGDIQMWLALAYQASGKEELCISTYKNLEAYHPMPAIKKQAYELRYIMEAPKLPLGEEDKVKVPVIQDGVRPNTGQYIPPSRRPRKAVKKSLEEKWADDYSPPEWVQNRYIWAAGSILLSGLAWYSTRLN